MSCWPYRPPPLPPQITSQGGWDRVGGWRSRFRALTLAVFPAWLPNLPHPLIDQSSTQTTIMRSFCTFASFVAQGPNQLCGALLGHPLTDARFTELAALCRALCCAFRHGCERAQVHFRLRHHGHTRRPWPRVLDPTPTLCTRTLRSPVHRLSFPPDKVQPERECHLLSDLSWSHSYIDGRGCASTAGDSTQAMLQNRLADQVVLQTHPEVFGCRTEPRQAIVQVWSLVGHDRGIHVQIVSWQTRAERVVGGSSYKRAQIPTPHRSCATSARIQATAGMPYW
jgi:hypothetical protein